MPSHRPSRQQLRWRRILKLNDSELAALTRKNTARNGAVFPTKTRFKDAKAANLETLANLGDALFASGDLL